MYLLVCTKKFRSQEYFLFNSKSDMDFFLDNIEAQSSADKSYDYISRKTTKKDGWEQTTIYRFRVVEIAPVGLSLI